MPDVMWPQLSERFGVLPWMVEVPPPLGLTWGQLGAYVDALEDFPAPAPVFMVEMPT